MTQPEDLHALSHETELVTDLCIVGSGPAGLAVARAFAGTALRVLVLESGRLTEDARIDRLNAIESDGHRRQLEQTRVRNRIFGGSTQTWMGRCTAFSEIDFEPRDWVPNSGWPISSTEVNQYLDRAAAMFELGPNIYDEKLFEQIGLRRPRPELDRQSLDTHFWQFSKNMEFPFGRPPYGPLQVGREFLRSPSANIRLLVNATVTHLNTNEAGDRIVGVEVSSVEGRRATVVARAVVLCGGGIENARMMLASNRSNPAGVGNTYDNVGRYLMDHLRLELGEFAPDDHGPVQSRFEAYRVDGPAGARAYLPGFALNAAVQRRERLLNCASWVELQGVGPQDPWVAARALLRRQNPRRLDDLEILAGQPSFVARGVWRSLVGKRGFTHKGGRLALFGMVEQVPDRDSRVTLSTQRDELGVPLSRVHWKVNERELETLVRTGELVSLALERAGIPAPHLFDWVKRRDFANAPVIDVAHPTGTTRMSAHPRDGVVDPNCQVHGVSGLFVAGSSVFPTAGHANPTLTIVALALRLAEHLKATVFAPALRETRMKEPLQLFDRSPLATAASNERRVLVTGGTGKIGRHLVSELVRRGYAVRVLSSRQDSQLPGVEVRQMNWLETLDFNPHVQGCTAVLHLGAELHDEAKMQRVNVEATEALTAAARAAHVRFFGYASTVSVYGSPTQSVVTEETPTLRQPEQYLVVPYLRAYAMTKLAGEGRVRESGQGMARVIYRPTVVVDADVVESMREWSRGNKIRYGGRRTNHVYVGDVVEAIIWLMERALDNPSQAVDGAEVFNLSDESSPLSSYRKLLKEGYRVTGDQRFRPIPSPPAELDILRDSLRYRSSLLHPKYPLGCLRFPPEKLNRAGFRHPFGLDAFYRRAFEKLIDSK